MFPLCEREKAIYNVCFDDGLDVPLATIDTLLSEGILQKSKSGKISMSKEYKKIASEIGVNRNNDDKVNDTYLIIKDNPGIQRKGISDFSSKSLSTIDRHIAILVKSGLVEHRGSDKTGGYYAKQ